MEPKTGKFDSTVVLDFHGTQSRGSSGTERQKPKDLAFFSLRRLIRKTVNRIAESIGDKREYRVFAQTTLYIAVASDQAEIGEFTHTNQLPRPVPGEITTFVHSEQGQGLDKMFLRRFNELWERVE